MAVLFCLTLATWAAPDRSPGLYSIPVLFKFSDEPLVAPGQCAQFRIGVVNPPPSGQTWLSTVVTDTIDPNLRVTSVGTSQGFAGWSDGDVTFTIGTVPPGRTVKLTVDVEVKGDAPKGYDVYNTAYMSRMGWPTIPSWTSPWMFRVAYLQHMPLTMSRFR
jgi:hypothetical protein